MKQCFECKAVKPLDEFNKRSDNGNPISRCIPCEKVNKKERMIRHRYGLEPQEYAEMMAKGCGVCGRTDGKLCIDHDHNCCPTEKTCGRCIRGVLCHDCNVAEGLLLGDVNRVMALAAYLLQSENLLVLAHENEGGQSE